MANYVLSCCSTVDVTKEHLDKRNIYCTLFSYELDGVRYVDDISDSSLLPKFYAKMAEGADTKTSQINADQFESYFEPFLQEGKDIVHISFSSGLSGTINSAMIAKSAMEEKYPDRKIYIVDSLEASSGYGLLMDKLADLRDEGYDAEQLVQWAEENKLKVHHWVLSTDLTYFVKGGRISKTSGFIGGVLNICPVINVNVEGKLIPRFKIRTKKKAIQAVVEQMELHAEGGLDYSGKCYVSHSDCEEDAKAVAALVKEKFPNVDGEVLVNYIGTTIGSHTGPGTVALFFWGDERVD